MSESKAIMNMKKMAVNKKKQSLRPSLNRDLLITLGEQLLFQTRLITLQMIQFLFINENVRIAVVKRLSKLNYLTVNQGYGRLSDKPIADKSGQALFINLSKNTEGIKVFSFLIKKMMDHCKTFITQLYINCVHDISVGLLVQATENLKGITHLCLPKHTVMYHPNGISLFEKLIQNNGSTLQVLKNVTATKFVPKEMVDKIAMINHITLSGHLKEQDYLTVYVKEAILEPIEGVAMNVSVGCLEDLLRITERSNIQNIVTHLYLQITKSFDDRSIEIILKNLHNMKAIWPKLQFLELKLKKLEDDPRQLVDMPDFDEIDIAPYSTLHCQAVTHQCIKWLNTNSLPYKIDIVVLLNIEYICNEQENVIQFKEFVIQRLIRSFRDFTLEKNQKRSQSTSNNIVPTCYTEPELVTKLEINDNANIQLEVMLQFVTFHFGNLTKASNTEVEDELVEIEKTFRNNYNIM